MHLSWQLNCRSLRCSWSIACRRCSNYIFILDWIHGFNRLGKDNCKTGRETLKFWDLLCLILETLRYLITSVLKSRTICRAWDLWKLAWSWSWSLLCLPDPWNLSGTASLSGFQSSQRSFEIHWVRQYLVNVVSFRIKDLQTYEMTLMLKSNLYTQK